MTAAYVTDGYHHPPRGTQGGGAAALVDRIQGRRGRRRGGARPDRAGRARAGRAARPPAQRRRRLRRPARREPERVREDVLARFVSVERARDVYGVAFSGDALDDSSPSTSEETARLRSAALSRFPSFRLDGKVAVVTGASSGIGAAVAQAMSEAGAKVVATGRDEARLRACADALRRPPPRRRRPRGRGRAAPHRRRHGRRVRGAQRRSSIPPASSCRKPFEEAPLEEFDVQFRVNVRAPYALTQAALPHLRPDGAVVFVSSIAGHVGVPALGRLLRHEGRDRADDQVARHGARAAGVRVNAVAPGNIHTPMNEQLLRVRRTTSGR